VATVASEGAASGVADSKASDARSGELDAEVDCGEVGLEGDDKVGKGFSGVDGGGEG
jgi:hypothetical protein